MKPIMRADKPESVVIEYNQFGIPKIIDYYYLGDVWYYEDIGEHVELSIERYTPKYLWDFENMYEHFFNDADVARLPLFDSGRTWLEPGADYEIDVDYGECHQLYCDTMEEAWKHIGLACFIAAERIKKQKKPQSIYTPLVCRIKEIRNEKGITQALLAKTSGVSRRQISDIENNKRMPTLEVAMELATALDEPIELLFERE